MPDAVIPLGVLSVMAATPGHHEKIFWDLCFEAGPLGTVARNLRESQPDLVAIGLRTPEHGLHEHHVDPGCIPRAHQSMSCLCMIA